MSQTLFVQEDKQWVNDPGQNAQYKRIARAWNAIHVYLTRNPEALCTSVIKDGVAFFRYKGELLMTQEFDSNKMVGDSYLTLLDFEGPAEGDLSDLADEMEGWLRAPSCIKRTAKHSSLVDLLHEIPHDATLAEFHPQYLTAEIPPSIADSFTHDAVEIITPDHLDFRA